MEKAEAEERTGKRHKKKAIRVKAEEAAVKGTYDEAKSSWENLKAGINKAADDVQDGINNAASKVEEGAEEKLAIRLKKLVKILKMATIIRQIK